MAFRFHFFLSLVFIVFSFAFGFSPPVSFAVESSELNFSSGTYIPGYTNSKWSSWGRLGGIIGGAPIDPVNQWVGCDPHNPDAGCWNPESTTFRCPEYSQVYEYAYDSITKNYQYYAPFEFINSGDTGFASQYLDLQKIRFERWEKCSASGSVVTPYGGQCGDGNVNIGEQCDPPGRTVLYDNSCPLGSYATATCNSSCQFEYGACSASTAVCGNGRVDSGEACDAGTQNGQYGSRCTLECQVATASTGQFCGNGTLDRNVQGNHLEFCEEQNGACVHIDETGQIIKSRVHTLLDRSGSMGTTVPGTGKTRWQNAVDGLTTIYTSLLSNVNFSLSVFSSSTTECYRDLGPITTANSNSVFNVLTPSGQTPTRCALQEVLNKKDSIFGTDDSVPKKLILITDGSPSDGTDQETAALIQQLKENYILTYVIGFGSVPSSILNLFAEAGGTTNPLSASDKFFKAEKASEFVTAFNEILGCFEYSQYKQNSCSWDCQNYGEYCGDGIVQQQHGEECEVSLSGSGSCNAYCKLSSGPPAVCGNTQVEAGEQCDDGNAINNDGCSATCSFESSVAACGNSIVETVNGIPEQCDLGPQNGLVCDPQYDSSCTYCSNRCETITLESDAFCGNGRVDAINPGLREACDYIGSDAVTSTGIVLQCPDKGNYTCSNSCLQLASNCVNCGTLPTSPIPKISILNPLVTLGNFPADYDLDIRSFRKNPPSQSSGSILALQILGNQRFTRAHYTSPLTPINLFSDTKGIEANMACNGEYALLFNKQRISTTLNDAQVVGNGLADLFDYEVRGEGGEVVNEIVASPAIPEDAIRIVTRWKKKPAGTLFMGEFYQDKINQSPTQNGNTFSYFDSVPGPLQDNNYNSMELMGGYWVPTRVIDGPPIAPGAFFHKFLNPEGSKTAVQGVTLYANALSSDKPLGFYVASPNGPINQYKDYELWVDVYTYHAGQVPEHSIYKPVSFSFDQAVPSTNPVARYWHVFNLDVSGSGNSKKLSVLPITGASAGLILTSQCEIRENMPETTRCGGLVPFSGGNNGPVLSLTVPSSATVGVLQNSTASVAVTSNVDSWTVTESISWLDVSPSTGSNNGTITLTTSQMNTTGANRVGTITVTGGGITRTITVTQMVATLPPPTTPPITPPIEPPILPSVNSLSVSPATVSLDAAANSVSNNSVAVTSNVSWTLTDDQPWLTVTPASGSNNGTLSFTATTANTASAPRTATVTVRATGLPNQTITVTQAGTAVVNSLTVSATTLNPTPNQGGMQFTVSSNVSWTVSDDQSWLTVTPASGSNNGTITLSYTANTGATRTGIITVTGGGITRTVTVNQAGTNATLSVSPTSITLGSAANSNDTFTITSNVAWTATDNQSWLTMNQVSGTGDTTIGIRATSANTSATSRTATITVIASGVTPQTITVTQAGTAPITPSLSVSPTSLSVLSSSGSSDVTINSNVSWTAAASQATVTTPAWLTVSPLNGSNNGTISVSRTANTSVTPRTGTITISGGGIVETINVTQSGVLIAPSLAVSSDTVTVSAGTTGNSSIRISSNIRWTATASNQTWLTISSPPSGSGIGDGSLFLSFSPNTGFANRTATITVTGGGITRQVTVTQLAIPALSLNPTTRSAKNTDSSSGSTITVTSNLATWTAVASQDMATNPPWFTRTSAGTGSGSGTVTYSFTRNTGLFERIGTITVSGGGLTRTFTLNQSAVDTLRVSPASPAVFNVAKSSSDASQKFTLSSNVNWTISDNAPWLSWTPGVTSGGSVVGDTIFTLSYPANTGAARSGIITISSPGLPDQAVTVNQAAGP